ncbi:MAG TPA: cytochrome c [Candidatus Acidoferrales bacterium]|nr:cytochrome c [Candidatus Acidoferrales bacterium]
MLSISKRVAAGLLLALVVCLGCRQDLYNQPRKKPYAASEFFDDGRSARPPVPGTIARGQLNDDPHLYTGRVNGQLVTTFPFPVDRAVLERGRSRYNIYCAPCHDRVGNGDGMVVLRGYRQPPSLHIDRLRQAPVGHYFDVMTNGLGAMPDYAAQIEVHDRWAIVAYIRALQLSQRATTAEVPSEEMQRLEQPK